MRPVHVTLALMLGLVAGCSFEIAECQHDDECPPGTRCRRSSGHLERSCLRDPFPGGEDAGSDARDVEQPLVDVASSPVDARVLQCHPSDSCGQEPNDEPGQATRLADVEVGCSHGEFRAWKTSVTSAVCSGDVDSYTLEVVPCRDGNKFFVEIELEPAAGCASQMTLQGYGELSDCDSPSLRCETDAGTRRIRLLVEGSEEYEPRALVFGVEAVGEMSAQYTLKVEVER